MSSLIHDYPHIFLEKQHAPCISLYQPTHRSHPENEQDIIMFKNLTKKIEKLSQEHFSSSQTKSYLERLHQLAHDIQFWRHTQAGLAVLANSNFFKVYKLPREVPEIAMVSDHFHIKPLIRIMQSLDRYQILGLNREEVKLYEGNRDHIHQIPLANEVPKTLEEALGHELTEPRLTVASYGTGAQGPAMRHGHGGKKDEVDIDIERFFKIIDSAIYKHHSSHSKLPLILASLPEYHGIYHKISHNPYLLTDSLKIHPDSVSKDTLKKQIWDLIEPFYLKRLKKLINDFSAAQSKNQGSDKLNEISKAAFSGKIATILIDSDQEIPGTIDGTNGKIKNPEKHNSDQGDLLDELGQLVLKTKGEVIIVPGERMPTKTGAAAIFRY